MRVLIFSNWYPPVVSGSSYYTSSLAQSLMARGHEITVVTLDWGAEYEPPQMPFPIHRLPVAKIPKLPIFYNLELMGFAFTPQNFRRLTRIIKEQKIDVVHNVNHIFDTTFLVTYVAKAARIPVVGTITTPVQHKNPVKQSIMGLADRLTIGAFGVKRWDGIVSLDHVIHERYVGGLYGSKALSRSAVIPFSVRLESLDDYGPPEAGRSPRPQILHVGHIHPFRNPENLVRAMPYVLERFPDAQLLLAGRVDLQDPVRAARELGLGPDAVRFLGSTPHEATLELMRTSHLYVSWANGPYPGLGTAPMEAMLCGTPVVNDLPEGLFGEGRLRDGENIVLTDSSDPRKVADDVIRLLGDEALRERIGAGGRRFVLEHLGWDNIAAEMERFYERVIAVKARDRSEAWSTVATQAERHDGAD
jgi:glycosyltransferase involved in cell wall biosynthesis